MRLLALLLLAGCAGSVLPGEQTPIERCTNAQRIVVAMRIGGAWGFAIEQAQADADEICGVPR